MFVPGGARLGFQVPDWKGAPWCPMQEVLVRRPHWVVEAVPKDPYYLFGKLVLRFDKDIFLGSYSSKYDWQGNLLGSYSADPHQHRQGRARRVLGLGRRRGRPGDQLEARPRHHRRHRRRRRLPADSRIPLSPNLFSLQRLSAGALTALGPYVNSRECCHAWRAPLRRRLLHRQTCAAFRRAPTERRPPQSLGGGP